MTAGAIITSFLGAFVIFGLVAKRLNIPYPIVFVIGGAIMGVLPGAPQAELNPDLVFLLFLPPLIFGDGWTTDVRTFLRYWQPIVLLAVGLVFFTSVAVAAAAAALLGFPLALGFVLGGILSPTDAVATEAIAEELHLPRRIAAILGGESLVNDASGLVIYGFAVVAVLTGAFSPLLAFAQFIYVVVAGVGIGLGGGWLIARVLHGIQRSGLSDELIAVTFSLVTPFALYVPADAVHASGVLAALSGGMMLSRKSSEIFDADSRIAASAVWNLLFFTFNGAAFVLIGLQLRSILGTVGVYGPQRLLVWSLGITAAVVAARYIWMFAVVNLRYLLTPRSASAEGPRPSWRVVAILGTAGMRGVVSLAAALALPRGFAHRDLILFIVFVVIVVTLVGQGLLLPLLIRRWGITESDDALQRGIALARVKMAEAVRDRMRELEANISLPHEWEVVGRLTADYEQRIEHFRAHVDGSITVDMDRSQHEIEQRMRREAFRAERTALLALRRSGTITDEAYRHVEWQIDLAESRLE